MRTTALFLASAIALCLVLPHCSAKPGLVSCVKKSAQKANSCASSSEQASSEQLVKKGGCGCGCGSGATLIASKKKSSRAAAASSSSSSSNFEAKTVVGGCGLTEVQIKEKYARRSGECVDAYYSRILSNEYEWTKSTDSYLKTLSLVRKNYCDLDLWYSPKYCKLVAPYYTKLYSKLESESWDAYVSRVIKKEKWETDDQLCRRIWVLRDLTPDYPCWLDEKLAPTFYPILYQRWSNEAEQDWVKRIFERDSYFDKSDDIWAKRLYCFELATFSKYRSLWYDEKYFCYTKKFFEIYYNKQKDESYDKWLARILTTLPGESYTDALARIQWVKKATANYGCWKVDYFRQIQKAKCFQDEWLSQIQKSFFPCGCGGGAVSVERSSKKSASASSSASASESSDYSKVVSA